MKTTGICSFISLIAFFGACDIYEQDEFEQQYVVEAYLTAQQPLTELRLSTTAPANERYSFEQNAIEQAFVEVNLLVGGEGSEVEDRFTYSPEQPGIFRSDVPHIVQPLRTYELVITFPNNDDIVRATTVIPDTFSVVSEVPESIVYQSPEQLQLEITQSSFPGRQNVFVFTTISLEPILENLTPLYLDLSNIDEDSTPEEINTELNNLGRNSSGIVNEANFEINNGIITLRYPWLAAAFFEDNLIVASTIDNNLFDFLRSQDVQLGGSTISPGEIQNVIYNINGGIGVFGALASDTVQTFISRN